MTNDSPYPNYYRQFTKLSVWYARKRILEGSSDFKDAFNHRVNIFRNTSFNNGTGHPASGSAFPQWDTLLDRVKKIFDAHIANKDTTLLEEESLEVFWPCLKERVEGLINYTPDPSERPYESWSHSYGEEDQRLHIHIANAYRPTSPLSDRRNDFAASLIRLLQNSQMQRPDIKIVSCGTWLNSVPAFQELFTETWLANAEVHSDIIYMLRFWGQFTDRRGDFHQRNGQKFRQSGTLPYPCTYCHDQIEAVLDHLTSHFPEAVAINQRRAD